MATINNQAIPTSIQANSRLYLPTGWLRRYSTPTIARGDSPSTAPLPTDPPPPQPTSSR